MSDMTYDKADLVLSIDICSSDFINMESDHMSDTASYLDLDLVWTAGNQPRRQIDADLFRLLEAIKQSGKLTVATEQVGIPIGMPGA